MNQPKIKPPGDDQFIGAYLDRDDNGEVTLVEETRSIFCDIPGFNGEKCTAVFYRKADNTYWKVCFHRGENSEIISELKTNEAVVSRVYSGSGL